MSDLGDRMKRYEAVSQTRLVPKVPCLIRLDGKAFRTLTRGLDKPVDLGFRRATWDAAICLCQEIAGCRLAYVQSDEISLLLVDYQTVSTQGWFDYEVQKLVSVAASIAAAEFGYRFEATYRKNKLAAFDARAWSLPLHEVTNYFIWRQQDATRNSVSGLAQAHFSAKQLHEKNGQQMQDMLHEKGINWNDCPIPQKRGVCVLRETYEIAGSEGPATRHRWVVDEAIPIFTEDREYVERFVRAPESVVERTEGR